ncbi:MAG: 50S ribosomal protein L4 [Dehalococcoidia bacterium]
MDLQVKDNTGNVVGAVEASDHVWAAPENTAVLHQAVVAQLANKRQGTHDTLNRHEVAYSTRKLRGQKHTGRARLGSRSSPVMGGSVAHGPHPRSYRQRLPKKMRRLALRVALSDKVRSERVTVIDGFSVEAPKTRAVKDLISGLGLQGSTLIVVEQTDANILKSVKNLPGVDLLEARLLNPLQAVSATNLLFTPDAVKAVNSLWGSEAQTAAEVAS